MPAVYELRHRVLDEEIDEQGHVGNLVYLRWALRAALEHSAAQGWPAERYRELGAGFVVRKHQIEYLRPALAGEEIVVRTWVSGFRKASSVRSYIIRRPEDDVVLAKAQTNWAFVRNDTGAPARLPAELIESFELVEGGADNR